MGPFDYLIAQRSEVLRLTVEHVGLVGVAMLLAVAAGVPLGIVAARHRRLGRAVIAAANVVQTIPSLALFGFLIPLPFLGGIGARTAIVALTLYSLLPIVRNTHAGIAGVDAAVIEAARGMGMTARQQLWLVEIPLALGVIVTGVRVATVIAIGVATIAAAIGAGGLGTYIFRGLAMVDSAVILAGAVPAAILAVAADLLLGLLARRLGAGR
jgi:osmoprotectant transport system permease protein